MNTNKEHINGRLVPRFRRIWAKFVKNNNGLQIFMGIERAALQFLVAGGERCDGKEGRDRAA